MKCALNEQPTAEEMQAVHAYASDARHFHAIVQGWYEELSGIREFAASQGTARDHQRALAGAILKCRLVEPVVLFSGHGCGSGIRGFLTGPPERFVGLHYCYPGFISTSSEEAIALGFLKRSRGRGFQPTLLEFRLPKEYQVLEMDNWIGQGEAEFVIGPNRGFRIEESILRTEPMAGGDFLQLVLTPRQV